MRGPRELNEAIWRAVGLATPELAAAVSEEDPLRAVASALSVVLFAPVMPNMGMVTRTGVSPGSQGRPLALSGVAPGMQLWMSPSKTPKPAPLLTSATALYPCLNAACAR